MCSSEDEATSPLFRIHSSKTQAGRFCLLHAAVAAAAAAAASCYICPYKAGNNFPENMTEIGVYCEKEK